MENVKKARLVTINPDRMQLSAESERILRGRMENVEMADPKPVQPWSVPALHTAH